MKLVRAIYAEAGTTRKVHWEPIRQGTEDTVWNDVDRETLIDVAALNELFKLISNGALKYAPLPLAFVKLFCTRPMRLRFVCCLLSPCLASVLGGVLVFVSVLDRGAVLCATQVGACRKALNKPREVAIIEGRRAHNVCIELSGIGMDVETIKVALTTMDLDDVTVDALLVLQRAVPTKNECDEIRAYLNGTHQRYKGMSDPNLMGNCEKCVVFSLPIPKEPFLKTYANTTSPNPTVLIAVNI